MSNYLSKFIMKGNVIEVIDRWCRDHLPTKTSELTNDSGFITSTDIPVVNDAKLKLQRNGVDIAEFTANQSSNVTANITVPTTATEISFNNTNTELSATNVQNAISEIDSNLSITSVTTPITSNGTSATLYKSGNVVTCKIETSNTQELGTQSTFATIGIIPSEYPEFIPNYSIIRYIQISSNLHGIFRIGTDGVIGLGYTVDQSGTSVPIPISTNIYDITTYVSN